MKNKLINQKGYTLIELLTVLIILTVVAGIIISIFVSALRGGNKSNTTNEVRENGNYLIVQMSKMLKYSRKFEGVSITGIDGSYNTNCVVPQNPLPTPPPSPVHYKFIKVSDFNNGLIIFSCQNSLIASNSVTMIDNTKFTVPDNNCYFICNQNKLADTPTIDINFSINKISSGFFTETQSTIPFNTSVTFRN